MANVSTYVSSYSSLSRVFLALLLEEGQYPSPLHSFPPSFKSCPPYDCAHPATSQNTHRVYKNGDALIRAVAQDQTASSAEAVAFGWVCACLSVYSNMGAQLM